MLGDSYDGRFVMVAGPEGADVPVDVSEVANEFRAILLWLDGQGCLPEVGEGDELLAKLYDEVVLAEAGHESKVAGIVLAIMSSRRRPEDPKTRRLHLVPPLES